MIFSTRMWQNVASTPTCLWNGILDMGPLLFAWILNFWKGTFNLYRGA